MAPKAKADAKSAPKADAKAKAKSAAKAKKVEEEKPRMEAPNFEAHQEQVGVVQAAIDKLQKEAAALSASLNGRSAGKEEFFAQKAVIRAELDEVSDKMNAIQEQKEQITKALGDKNAEKQEMKQQLGKMKKSMGFTSEADIDERIATIEFKMWTESVSLKQEKEYLAEIKELKKNKPKISQVSEMQNKLQGFESGADLTEKRKALNEQMAVFRDQKKAIQEKLLALTEKRKEQMGDFTEVAEKRDAISKQIQEKIAERQKLRDEFSEAKREFQNYLAEQRRIISRGTRRNARSGRLSGRSGRWRSRLRSLMNSLTFRRSH